MADFAVTSVLSDDNTVATLLAPYHRGSIMTETTERILKMETDDQAKLDF